MPTLQELATSIANTFDIPPDIFHSLIKTESSWNPAAVGSSGEYGLTQLMPNTAASLGVTSPFDVTQNLTGGATYLSQMFDKYGDWQSALSAYNSGSPNSEAGLAYAAKVLGGAGLTGSNMPGVQPVANQPPPGASASTPKNATVIYVVAIFLVLLLVGFGIWGVVKG